MLLKESKEMTLIFAWLLGVFKYIFMASAIVSVVAIVCGTALILSKRTTLSELKDFLRKKKKEESKL